MSIKQAIEALEVAQDALDISQSLQESAKSNHHPKTLAAYERVSAALAALRSMPQGEPVAWMNDEGDVELSHKEWMSSIWKPLYDTPHTEAVDRSEKIPLLIPSDSRELPTEAVRMSEAWQPIETAPKDGTVVLLCRDDRVTAGHWEPERWPTAAEHHSTTGEYLGQFETGECVEAWWYSEDGGFCEETQPTHWMPLPPPPVEQATAARLGVKMGDV